MSGEDVLQRTPHANNYDTARGRAWRNAMVAGINGGVDKGLFTLRAGDNSWPGAQDDPRLSRAAPYIFGFEIGNIPAIASVFDAGWDELSVHVALWPSADGRRWLPCWNAGFAAGEVFAAGWLERRDGAWLQVERRPYFWCRKNRLATVSELSISPKGFADRGSFRF